MTGLGLIYVIFTQMNQIPIKLVLILLAVVVGGTWAAVGSLFLRIEEGLRARRAHCRRQSHSEARALSSRRIRIRRRRQRNLGGESEAERHLALPLQRMT